MKVVLNRCWGGFSISQAAAEFMAKRGNRRAKLELAEFKENSHWYGYGYSDDKKLKNENRKDGRFDGYERTDPDLIAAIEELGAEICSGAHAKLSIVNIPDDIEWNIHDYDGQESIHEEHRSW